MDESGLSTTHYFSNREIVSDYEAKAELLTDQILDMMIDSDIVENTTHPFRSQRIILDNRHKFPFNKPTGIDVSLKQVKSLADDLIKYILGSEDKPLVKQSIN